MKTFAFFILIGLISTSVYAEVSSPELSRGGMTYQDHFLLHQVRRSEKIAFREPAGAKRLKERRQVGDLCLRSNPQTYICHHDEFPQSSPPEFAAGIARLFKNFEIDFVSEPKKPELIYDGASQEWLVRDPVKIGTATVNLYKIILDREQTYFVFPVSDEQGLGVLNYHSAKKLGASLQAQRKIDENTVETYSLESFFEPKNSSKDQ